MTTINAVGQGGTHPEWPRVMVFPGQAGGPAGPVDMTMMYVMHHGFRRDLTVFVTAAQRTPVTDRATWSALSERWGLFATILHHHHSGEDAGLWPALLERSGPADVATLEAMEAEHAEIDPILASCAEGFARLARHADADARAALVVRLTAARESLGRHLAHEETEALQIAQRVLTEADWQRLEEEHFRKGLSFRQVLGLVAWAAHEMPAELRDEVFAKGPAAQRALWRVTRPRFERRERTAFHYVD